MTIENKVEPYELLVRWEDGRVKGAHFKEISTVTKDGDVIAVTEEIRSVKSVEVSDLLGKEQAALLEQLADQEKEMARLEALAGAAVENPTVVSMAQARIALRRAGLLEQVEAVMAAIPDKDAREDALTAWEYSTVISRNGALVSQLAPLLGLKDEEIDSLFEAAREIKL